MSALFDVALSHFVPRIKPRLGGYTFGVLSTVGKASVCAAGGLVTSSVGLYQWHVIRGHMDGGLYENVISKAIIMASVGVFGVGATALINFMLYSQGDVDSSLVECLRKDTVCLVVICLAWCFVWLVAEVFSQCFVPFTETMSGYVPQVLTPFIETAYVEAFSSGVLPAVRVLVGYLERFFLPRQTHKVESSDKFPFSLRTICWIDFLFEGFRWQYNRIVFSKSSGWTLALVTFYHVLMSLYLSYWKYSPHRTASRIAYWYSKCRLPPPWVRKLATLGTVRFVLMYAARLASLADLVSAHLFTSTHFVLGLAPGGEHLALARARSKAYRAREEAGVRCISTLTVLNHRFNIYQRIQGMATPAQLAGPYVLEMTETVAAALPSAAAAAEAAEAAAAAEQHLWIGSTAAKKAVAQSHELAHVHLCVLSLQQHIELRLCIRQTMRIYSSMVLLATNLTLGATRSHIMRDAAVVGLWSPRVWAFPCVMLLTDLFDVACHWHSCQRWVFSFSAIRRWRTEVFGDPIFLLAQLCLMLHVSMSPTFGRHALLFCT